MNARIEKSDLLRFRFRIERDCGARKMSKKSFVGQRVLFRLEGLRWRNVSYLLLTMIFTLVAFLSQAINADQPSFPRILSLSEALSMIDEDHPDVMMARSQVSLARAEKLALDAQGAVEMHVRLEWRQVDRLVDPSHHFIDDSRATLLIDKPITRFGRDRISNKALNARVAGLFQRELVADSQMRLNVVRAFFDVIVSDYAHAAVDEEMTLSFLAFSRARDRMEEYQEIPEVEVRRLESVYLSLLARRTATADAQRMSRLKLALALNRPDAYPSQVIEPVLSDHQRDMPDYDALFEVVSMKSPEIIAARLEVEEAEQRLTLTSRKFDPTLGLQLQGVNYAERFSGSRDQYRAMVYLDIPIGSALSKKADIETSRIRVLQSKATLQLMEHRLREQVLGLVHRLGQLNSEVNAAKAELLYRELELDKVRLQYEMEVRARIGSANAEVAKALYHQKRMEYERALIWEQIYALSGEESSFFSSEG
ncbi:MAG: hypothetical protein GKR96_14400 [Gammaproteobacteria bacterium]|nr:hypothetical protein [Gammaproteobacteria bacterium]